MTTKEVGKPARAMRMMDIIAADSAQARRVRIDRCIRDLAAAEAAAKAKALKDKTAPKFYLVNYRITDGKSLKGTENERREALIEIIRSLAPKEYHQSTSSWLVTVYLSAEKIASFLVPVLDDKLDGLHVWRISSKNRKNWGFTDLEN